MNLLAPSSAIAIAIGISLPAGNAASYQSDMSSGVNWGTNASSADASATFGYDYSADGIPEAPNNLGGTATSGVKLQANIAAPGSSESIVIYPIGQHFTGNYTLRFDAWMNYDAHATVNGGPSPEFMGGGIGYNNVDNSTNSGAMGVSTNDGGSASDWRIFANGAFLGADLMAAVSRDGSNAHYSDFLPGVAPPSAQNQVSFPAGISGSPGFQWITWEISHLDDMVSILIEKPGGDRLEIISFEKTATGSTVGTDGNISLLYADFFTSVSPRPDLTFGIIDNVVVFDAIPEPSHSVLVLMGFIGWVAKRRR